MQQKADSSSIPDRDRRYIDPDPRIVWINSTLSSDAMFLSSCRLIFENAEKQRMGQSGSNHILMDRRKAKNIDQVLLLLTQTRQMSLITRRLVHAHRMLDAGSEVRLSASSFEAIQSLESSELLPFIDAGRILCHSDASFFSVGQCHLFRCRTANHRLC